MKKRERPAFEVFSRIGGIDDHNNAIILAVNGIYSLNIGQILSKWRIKESVPFFDAINLTKAHSSFILFLLLSMRVYGYGHEKRLLRRTRRF